VKSCRPPPTVKNSAASLLLVAANGRSPVSTDSLAPNGPVYSCRIIAPGPTVVGRWGGGVVRDGVEVFGIPSQVL